jgi:SAM-dependent methyltransferase
MTDSFDKDYWETHWKEAAGRDHDRGLLPNPYLARELGDLDPGSALDAGCGEGVEAIWLAVTGWQVTAADISAVALSRARGRAGDGGRAAEIEWVEADLSVWEPDRRFDLVMTHYAHPAMGQLAFYERIADWVAPGGTLLIVGHLRTHDPDHDHHHDHDPPEEVQVTAGSIVGLLDADHWTVITADEVARTVRAGSGRTVQLHDVVVRASRRARDDRDPR